MLETLLGGLFGGLLRLAPEVLKWLDRKDERKHELDMQDKALAFEDRRQAGKMAEYGAALDQTQFAALSEAFKQQAAADAGAGKFAALSSSVRPVVTYALVALYAGVKLAHGDFLWTDEDQGLLASVLGFWFVSRAITKG